VKYCNVPDQPQASDPGLVSQTVLRLSQD